MTTMTRVSSMRASRNKRVRRLVAAIEAQGGSVLLRSDGGVTIKLEPVVPIEMRKEVAELKVELADYLSEQETVITDDPDAIIANRTPPRSAAEVDADARKAQAGAAKRREYQSGAVN